MKHIMILAACGIAVLALTTAQAQQDSVEILFAEITAPIKSPLSNMPVDAVISKGKYKKMVLHGRLDANSKVISFSSLDNAGKLSKISAYAIDEKTAVTALKSKPTSEYLRQNANALAASFVQAHQNSSKQLRLAKNTVIGVLITR